jgi:hypothetical protein
MTIKQSNIMTQPQPLNFDLWLNTINPGEEIELSKKGFFSENLPLGVYNVKKNTDDYVSLSRKIPEYHYLGLQYDQENNVNIDANNYNQYRCEKPSNKPSYDTWYDSIDESQAYQLEENTLFGNKKLDGNYNVRKIDTTKTICFRRKTSIMSRFMESDQDNTIYVSQSGVEPRGTNNYKSSYDKYYYYSQPDAMAEAEEAAKYVSIREWF